MLKILQAKLQQYMNQELLDVQAGFRKGSGTRDQIANMCWITENAREFQKNICFIDYAKVFDCVDHNKLWEILKEMGIPDYPTCLLWNLCVDLSLYTDYKTLGRNRVLFILLSPELSTVPDTKQTHNKLNS